jgi:hypothetical protein
VLLTIAAPLARAVDGDASPSCVPEASVRENPGFNNDIWLSKERGDTARMFLSKVMDSRDWRGNELYRGCAQVSTPCMVVRLEDGTPPGSEHGDGLKGGWRAQLQQQYQELARASGHTKQEADVLAGRYATLAGAYYRQVPKEGGGWESESVAITRKHQKQLGIQDPSPPPSMRPGGDSAAASDLKARMQAAKKRGDTAEMMRLAGEAQNMAAGASKAAEPAQAMDRDVKRNAWRIAESSYTELLTAAYWSRIYLSGMCMCRGPCRLPIGEGADRVR